MCILPVEAERVRDVCVCVCCGVAYELFFFFRWGGEGGGAKKRRQQPKTKMIRRERDVQAKQQPHRTHRLGHSFIPSTAMENKNKNTKEEKGACEKEKKTHTYIHVHIYANTRI